VLKELQRSLTYFLPLLDLHVDNKKMLYLLKSDKKKDVLLQRQITEQKQADYNVERGISKTKIRKRQKFFKICVCC
jgi:hypothetical protein